MGYIIIHEDEKKTIIVMSICRHSDLQIPLYPHQKWMVITKPARGEMHMLEDFVMFGFFTGSGRSTSAYLAARGVRDMEENHSPGYLSLWFL